MFNEMKFTFKVAMKHHLPPTFFPNILELRRQYKKMELIPVNLMSQIKSGLNVRFSAKPWRPKIH